MEVLYISHKVGLEYLKRKNINSPRYEVSNVKWCNLISKGLNHCDIVNSLSEIAAPTFTPWPQSPIIQKNEVIGNTVYLFCLNLTVLKNIVMTASLFRNVRKWANSKQSSQRLILLSSVHPMFLLALIPFRSIKIVAFVPDIPSLQFRYTKQTSFARRLFIPLYLKLCQRLEKNINGFVFITKYMSPFFPGRPYTIMEGLVDPDEAVLTSEEQNNVDDGVFRVFYAGALFEKMGMKNLVESLNYIPKDFNIELVIAGVGDMVEYIRNYQQRDNRLKYLGRLTNKEVIEYEHNVNLLINPRPTTENYVKYSFPSKTMEYMLSATPVLTTKLPGIPDEYDEHLFYIYSENAEGIADSIIRCMKMAPDILKNKGKNAQSFILKNKNCEKQIDKVINDLRNWI